MRSTLSQKLYLHKLSSFRDERSNKVKLLIIYHHEFVAQLFCFVYGVMNNLLHVSSLNSF